MQVLTCESILSCSCCLVVSADVYMWRTFSLYGAGLLQPPCLLQLYILYQFCPKHIDFYSKNKFDKLVHLVGFIIRINHDARSSECQILLC